MSVLDLLYGDPTGAVVDLPSGIQAHIREMTGAEQKTLTTRTKMVSGLAVNEVLSKCITQLGETDMTTLGSADSRAVVEGLLSGDRKALMFHIRRLSLGSTFMFKSQCPHCEKQQTWEVALSDQDFKVIPYKFQELDGVVNRRMLQWTSTVLPNVQLRATFLTGKEETRAIMQRAALNGLSDLELRSVMVLDEEKVWRPVAVLRCKEALLNEIRQKLHDHEGDLDDSVSLVCPDCGGTAEFNLVNQPDFMLPSAH